MNKEGETREWKRRVRREGKHDRKGEGGRRDENCLGSLLHSTMVLLERLTRHVIPCLIKQGYSDYPAYILTNGSLMFHFPLHYRDSGEGNVYIPNNVECLGSSRVVVCLTSR